eukprot:GHVT01016209.1.p1 GENE.GHVT01016209.1~~GHVT01016209.1.p1  ORF type:complete len:164 (+),score=19.22 GHVT01016209.1:457-948(+)
MEEFFYRSRNGWRQFSAWYSEQTPRKQNMILCVLGTTVGTATGKLRRRQQVASGDVGSSWYVTTYQVPPDGIKDFESRWNRYGRWVQKQPGYRTTQLYKAVHWDAAPASYIQIRQWRRDEHAEEAEADGTGSELSKAVAAACSFTHTNKYDMVVDDSVRRLIV